ncbi:putative signal peptidase I [Dioscorea sansibarensis]
MGSQNFLWQLTKRTVTGALIGVTISDRYMTVSAVRGSSMYPTFQTTPATFPGSLKGDLVLAERFCLERYKFSLGDVIIFQAPDNHKKNLVKRLIALPGQWIQIPESSEMLKIPEGHCWVEGDNSACSLDSRSFGPIPLGLVKGRVTHVIWPPHRIGAIERKVSTGRTPPC